jgi:secreted PhoX family phosphatase
VHLRLAAEAVGATPMDRPEDVEVDPRSGRVYIALTRSELRTPGRVDAANPRGPNLHGHLIELVEAGDDPTGERFAWDLLLLGGPAEAGGTARGDILSCPDNLAFSPAGNLWVATDGQPKALRTNDAVYVVGRSGAARGHARRFLGAVPGAEVCGPAFDREGRTFFCAIQHPAGGVKGSTFDAPVTRFPNTHEVPRPCVLAVYRADGRPIDA